MDTLPLSQLTAVSAIDGRYGEKTATLRALFSEYGLFRQRVRVEIVWLNVLLDLKIFHEVANITLQKRQLLMQLAETFNLEQAQQIKQIEAKTNHDVKAVEYFIADYCQQHSDLQPLIPLLHFACTSEDINNLSWALILKQARDTELLKKYQIILHKLTELAQRYASTPMLAKTHGQSASPTTVGKEFANVAHRLHGQMKTIERVKVNGKFNGAVGNFNAHTVAFPDTDWPAAGKTMVESLGLEYSPYTTQIEPHDYIAELLHAMIRTNTVLIDLSRDVWAYISLGYFGQRAVQSEVGSSTMPHKINPIQFENAEGNFCIANSLANGFAEKLPISRWQRDLSDSTVLRSLGSIFAHTIIALDALMAGLDKLELDEELVLSDLDQHWEILAEAVQIVLRKHGVADAYEQLKHLTRGKQEIDKDTMQAFIKNLDLPADERDRLLALSPQTYTGLAEQLTQELCQLIQKTTQ